MCDDIGGRGGACILQHIGEVILFIVNEGRIERNRRFGDGLKFNNALFGEICRSCQLFGRWVMSQLLIEMARNTFQLINKLHHMYRNMNGACMLGDGPADGLTNPPCGIGAETEAASRIKFLYCANEAEVAFLHEV